MDNIVYFGFRRNDMKLKSYFNKFLRKTILKNKTVRKLKRIHNAELRELKKREHRSRDEWKEIMGKDYENFTGHKMNWENPERFTQKIVWRMFNDPDPVYSQLSDKYAVREWVAKKIGKEYLIPLLGVWNRAKDIDFDSLPDQFVLKTNNASATNIIVRDKKSLKRKQVIEQFRYWMKYPCWAIFGEFHYKAIKPKIIAEKFILRPDMDDLPDYKFFCFDGKVVFSYTMIEYIDNHNNGKLGFFDRSYKLLPFYRKEYLPIKEEVPKPENYDKMVEIAEVLSKGFSHVRVDLYNVKGKIYFGEMTFTTSSGKMIIEPDEWDYKVGGFWDITKPQVDGNLVDI